MALDEIRHDGVGEALGVGVVPASSGDGDGDGVASGVESSAVGEGLAVGVDALEAATVQNSFAGTPLPDTPSVLYPIFDTVTPEGSPTPLQKVCVAPGGNCDASSGVAVQPSKPGRAYAVSAP